MRVRSETVEHPFATLRMRMGATHLLMKTLPKVATEIALHVLAYYLTRDEHRRYQTTSRGDLAVRSLWPEVAPEFDSRADGAKICSDGLVVVDHAQLREVLEEQKTFSHDLDPAAAVMREQIARHSTAGPLKIYRLCSACRAICSRKGTRFSRQPLCVSGWTLASLEANASISACA